MRTPTKPWYRASKDAWYVEFNGRQVRLAKGRDNEKAARDAFYKLMANGSGKLPDADTLRVATVCDLFLDYSQKHHVPDTYRWYQGLPAGFLRPVRHAAGAGPETAARQPLARQPSRLEGCPPLCGDRHQAGLQLGRGRRAARRPTRSARSRSRRRPSASASSAARSGRK